MKQEKPTFRSTWVSGSLQILLLFLVVGGCAVGEGMGASVDDENRYEVSLCYDDGDCDDDLKCDLLVNLCVASEPVAQVISMRVIPTKENSAAVEEQFSGLEIEASSLFNFVLHRPVRVLGKLTSTGSTGRIPKDASLKVVASGTGDIPGKSYQRTGVNSNPVIPGDFSGSYDFEIFLQQDRPYDIFLYLETVDGTLNMPPFHVHRSFYPDSDQTQVAVWEVALPAEEDCLSFTGRVVLDSGGAVVPVAGARVYITSEVSGDISSTKTTDDEGYFQVFMQPQDLADAESGLKLHVKPSEQNPLVPEVNLDIEGAQEQESELGEISLGLIQAPVEVTFLVRDSEGIWPETGLQESLVRVGAQIGSGLYINEAVVDGEGAIVMNLSPGEYAVSVMPPSGGGYSLSQQVVSISPGAEPPVLELRTGARPVVSGKILSSSGEPVSQAVVTGVMSEKGAYPIRSPLPERRFITTSDSDGNFSMQVDPGQYVFIVDPHSETPLPRLVEPYVYVTASLQRTFYLKRPIVVSGKVEGHLPVDVFGEVVSGGSQMEDEEDPNKAPLSAQDIVPMAGVKLEVFAQVSEQGRASTDVWSRFPLAEGWADSAGQYMILIPGD